MDLTSGNLSRLIERIYDAATDASAIPEVLAQLTTAFDACAATFFTPSLSPQQGGLMAQHQIDAGMLQRYQAYYGQVDPWWQAGQRMQRDVAARPHVDEELVPIEVLRRSEFFADFLRPAGLERGLTAIVQVPVGGTAHEGALAFHGARGHPGFTEDHKRALGLLLPHLQRSVRLSAQLAAAKSRAHAGLEVLEAMAHGAVLLDQTQSVLHVSASSHATLQRAGILVQNGRLASRLPRNQHALDALLDRAFGEPPSGGAAALRPSDRGRAIIVASYPVPRSSELLSGTDQARALLLFRDSNREAITAWDAFSVAFRLTAAELRVCQSMARGLTLAEHSASVGVTLNTTRSQLKAVFSKVSVSRQAELIRLMAAFGR